MDHHRQSEIEHAVRNELTSEEREILARGRELLLSLTKGQHLDDWLSLGPPQKVRSRLAMRLAHTNQRKGAPYTRYLHQILQYDGIDTTDKKMMSNLTALSWLVDDEHPERLELLHKERARMSQGELSRMNSPITARKFVTNIIDPRAAGAPKQQDELTENKEEKRAVNNSNSLSEYFKTQSVEVSAAELIEADTKRAERLALSILASLNVKIRSAR